MMFLSVSTLTTVLLWLSANAKEEKSSQQIIQDHIRSLRSTTGAALCDNGMPCCNVTTTESCPISAMKQDESTIVLPGGETRCIYSYSTPFAFQVIPGESDKLLFYFQGGGACWDESSSSGGFCTTDAVPQSAVGVFNRENAANKYKDYTIVHLMYCSGDLFAGDVTRSYNDSQGVPIVQKGLANAQSALDWVVAQTKNGGLASTFADVVVMGCSAGSLATQLWSKQVMTTLKWSQAAVVPDSYAGVFPAGSVGPLVYSYGFCNSGFLSEELVAKCLDQSLSLEEILIEFASAIPTVPFNYLQSKTDWCQQAFYDSVGASMDPPHKPTTPTQFYTDTNTVFGTYNDKLKNFVTYLMDGDQHCFTCYDLFYTADAKGSTDNGTTNTGVMLSSWVGNLPLAEGESQSTSCEGQTTATGNKLPDNSNTYCASVVYPKEFVEDY